ncbi:MAG: MOSC domain-containing protein [Robiginitomaculum sp.]|nr:MAG: MOSC domain-containing protein [Robiginitomaculum sp.]
MTNMSVKSLHIYPVKSGHGVDLQTVDVHQRGLRGDRRFMLVDAEGMFITQRQSPKLAQLHVQTTDMGLVLSWPDREPLIVGFPDPACRKSVKVWRSQVDTAIAAQGVNDVLSIWLEKPVALVFMDGASERLANEAWTHTPAPVSFADGYPVLVTNTASLEALNTLISANGEASLPMRQFRPNIVIQSDEPWGEDGWTQLTIGDVVLDLVKPCARCVMTTLDQNTGEKQGREPLRALKTLRSSTDPRNPGVIFGMNAVPRQLGVIRVGDMVSTGA